MAKKKRKTKEMTIEQKEVILRQNYLIQGIITCLILFILGLYVDCSLAQNARIGYLDAITKALSYITQDPTYIFPINYSLNNAFFYSITAATLTFVGYTYQKMRVHHDVNTLKGRTHWANFDDILERYGEKEEHQ